MRPTRLDRPVQFLKGVGPRWAERLQRMGIVTARDLLYHVPRRYDDASTITPVALAQVGMDVTLVGEVRSKGIVPTRAGLRIFQAVIQDDSGILTCSWPGQPWVERGIRRGDRILVTGPVRFFHGRQIQPREFVVLARAFDPASGDPAPGAPSSSSEGPGASRGTIFSTYPASEEVPQWVIRRVVSLNLEVLLRQIDAEDHLPRPDRVRLELPGLASALGDLHRPPTMARKDQARRRLAFDELFLLQLMQARVRHQATRDRPGIAHRRTNRLIRALHDRLPFRLTDAQTRVLREVVADMTAPERMNRLVQGDVGCGKTVVALFAMLLAVEGGRQAALMAPTEILAEQHARTVEALLGDLPCTVQLVTGALSGRRREVARARVASGEAQLVVGTHALIQEGMAFSSLGLVVVDEQHRFGVRQRMALQERDPRPDTLLMSATPIPRSLAMTLHGDLDVSRIDELPRGRTPVETRIVAAEDRAAVLAEVARRARRGGQAYLVYPAIEASDKTDLLAAETEFERLQGAELAGCRIALLHGRLSGEEKDRIMRSFGAGDIDVLVATTVVEVGLDVPAATMMVIENAERFGLSQLHQLRGRVGRGRKAGLCVVMAPGEGATERLTAFAGTTDGFRIAAEDLRIRGQGDFFGAEQHGHRTEFKFADIIQDEDLLEPARTRARAMIDADPELADPAHALTRAHLERRYEERARLYDVG